MDLSNKAWLALVVFCLSAAQLIQRSASFTSVYGDTFIALLNPHLVYVQPEWENFLRQSVSQSVSRPFLLRSGNRYVDAVSE